MTTPDPHFEQQQAYWIRLALVLLLTIFGLWIAREFIAAVIWAAVIAVAIDPIHSRLRNRWKGRVRHTLLAILITLGIALVVLIPLAIGIAQAINEAGQIGHWISQARAHGVPPPVWLADVPYAGASLVQWWQTHLASPKDAAVQLNSVLGSNFVAHTRVVGSNILHRSIVFLFTLLTLFFVLRDRDAIIGQLQRGGERLLGPAGERVGQQAINSVRATIDGLVLVGMGEGAVMTLVYVFLGTPHPLLFGVLTAIAATIPFGAAFMFSIAAVLHLMMGSVADAIIVIVMGLIVVGIADHFIRPAIIGGSARLPFLWVLIGILGGAATLGVLGLFVGPATMAVLIMLWRDYVDGAPGPDATGDDG